MDTGNALLLEASGFDIIGDVHGCRDELTALLLLAGWRVRSAAADGVLVDAEYPADPARRLAFVGDLVNRGPDSAWCARSVRNLVAAVRAVCVAGNHDSKLGRALRPGSKVERTPMLEATLAHLAASMPTTELAEMGEWMATLPAYGGLRVPAARLVWLAHAGIDPEMIGKSNGKVRTRCLYGVVLGTEPESGLPIRSLEWTSEWASPDGPLVVYGHTPLRDGVPVRRHETVNIDTACSFGGRLTMLRWPENECVQVPCAREGGYV